MSLNVVVEGFSDQGAATAVVGAAGRSVARVVVKRGKGNLDPLIPKYNIAARFSPWVVFRDSDAQCPVELREELIGTFRVNPCFSLRIAHSMTEAWLMADAEAFSSFFGVPAGRVPSDVEALVHAKRSMLELLSTSRSRAMRSDLVREDGEAGPLYVARVNDYASSSWRPTVASERSRSLARAIAAIRALPEVGG